MMMEDDVNVHVHAQVSESLLKGVHEAEDQPREAEKEEQKLLIHNGIANHDPDISHVFVNSVEPAHPDLNVGDLSIPFSSSANNNGSASEEKSHYSREHDKDDVDIELKVEDRIQVEMDSEDCTGGSVMSVELVEEGIPEKEINSSTSSNETKQFEHVGRQSEQVSVTDVKETQEFEIIVGADVQNRLAEKKELDDNDEGPESGSASVAEGKEAQELKNIADLDEDSYFAADTKPQEFENTASAAVQNGFREEKKAYVDVDEIPIESKPRTKSERPEDDLDEDSSFAPDTKPQEFENTANAAVQNGFREEKEACVDVDEITIESKPTTKPESPEEDLDEDSSSEADTKPQELKNTANAAVQNGFREEKEACVDVDEIAIESKPTTKPESPEDDLDEDSSFAADTKPQEFKNTANAAVQNGFREEKEACVDVDEIPIESKPRTKPESPEDDLDEDSIFAADTKPQEFENTASAAVQNGFRVEKEACVDVDEIAIESKPRTKSESPEDDLDEDSSFAADTKPQEFKNTARASAAVQNGFREEKEACVDVDEIPIESKPRTKSESPEGDLDEDSSFTAETKPQEFENTASATVQNGFREEKGVDVDEIPIESKPTTKSESPEDDLDEDSNFVADTKPQEFENTASAVVLNGFREERDLHEDVDEIPSESKQRTEPERLGEASCEDSSFVADTKIDAVVFNGVVTNESNDDALIAGCIQETGSTDVKSNEIADENNTTFECIGSGLGSIDSNQDASQQDGSIESDKTSSIPVIGDNALIESDICGTNVEKIKICKNSVCTKNDANTEIESEELAAERREITDSPVHDAKLEIEPENVLLVDKDKPGSPPDHALTDDSAISINHVEMDVESCAKSSTENWSNSLSDSVADAKLEIEPKNVLVDEDKPALPPDHTLTDGTAISFKHGDETDAESHANSSIVNGSSLHSGPVADVKFYHDGKHLSSLISGDMPGDDNVTSDTNDNAKAVESAKESQLIRFGSTQEVEVFSGIHGDENPRPSQEGSVFDMDRQNMGEEVGKRPFNYLIRLPRCDNENIKEQIKYAKFRLDEENKNREAIQAEVQIQKATCIKCNQDVESVKSAEKAAWEMLKAKRHEMDSVQSIVARLNTAISVEDIDVQIRNMEHMIEHETLPLKEEKQLLRQIKQLKQHREELSSNMGKEDLLQPSQDYKDRIEEHIKHLQLLRKEVESLRQDVRKAEAVTQAAKRKHDEECNKLGESRARYRAADEIRQEAYAKLKNLKEELYEKTKYFWDYKNAVTKANELAAEGKIEEMQRICCDQVERIMELWNKKDEFRKEYVRCNFRSTLRRLRTMDGRSLGPDEEPPAIPSLFDERTTKNNSLLSLRSTPEQEKKAVPAETVNKQDEPVPKVGLQSNQATKTKKPAKAAPLGKSLVMVSSWDEAEDVKKDEPLKTKEEEELIRKAEEMRKEEEATRLKEKLRLEEMAKAKEAMERKKRNADKAQQRAALRAQKEAEQKEKEREKKARKKERRKAAAAIDPSRNTGGGEYTPGSEIQTPSMEECEQTEKPVEVTKRPQKPSQFMKQTKAKALPPPLRNRGKRRMQSWIWALVTILVVVALFILCNSGFSSSSGLQGFGL